MNDPLGIRKLEAEWKFSWRGAKPLAIDPGTVAKGDFVIIRAPADAEDASCFKISGIEVPLFLCKVSSSLEV